MPALQSEMLPSSYFLSKWKHITNRPLPDFSSFSINGFIFNIMIQEEILFFQRVAIIRDSSVLISYFHQQQDFKYHIWKYETCLPPHYGDIVSYGWKTVGICSGIHGISVPIMLRKYFFPRNVKDHLLYTMWSFLYQLKFSM